MLKPRKSRSIVWSSPVIALLAAAGAMAGVVAPGHLTGTMAYQGGSVFLVFYLLIQLLVGIPLMMGWLYLGRQSTLPVPAGVVLEAVRESKLSRFWAWLEPCWLLWTLLFAALLTTMAAGALTPIFDSVVGVEGQKMAVAFVVVALLVWLMLAWGGVWLGRLVASVLLVVLALSIWQLLQGLAAMDALLWQGVFGWRFDEFAFSSVLAALYLVLLTSSLGGGMLWVVGRYLPERPHSLAIWSVALMVFATLLMLLVGMASMLGSDIWVADALPVLSAVLALAVMSEALVASLDKRKLVRPLGALLVVVVTALLASFYWLLPALSWLKVLALHWLPPLAILSIAILVGWMLKETKVRKAMAIKNFSVYLVSRALLRLLVPLSAIVLLLREVGLW